MGIVIRTAEGRDLPFLNQDADVDPVRGARAVHQNEVFVAELHGECVGFVRIEYLWSVQPYISLIRVVEPHRRRGVGRALLSHIERILRDAGHSTLLSSSQVDEPEPQAWHRRMGFSECGIINGLNEGAVGEVFFRKSLQLREG